MRKVGLLAVLLLLSLSGFAQKSYIFLEDYLSSSIRISGDVPSDIDGTYIGYSKLINKLAAHGFEIEFVNNYNSNLSFLLSKDSSKPTNGQQKSYLFLVIDKSTIYIPLDIDNYIASDINDIINEIEITSMKVGDGLNYLSEKGYKVEFMNYDSGGSEVVILSKVSSDQSSGVRNVVTNDGEPKEVARYNLQGFPIKESDKGFQIIVYSDYTAKTVIVR